MKPRARGSNPCSLRRNPPGSWYCGPCVFFSIVGSTCGAPFGVIVQGLPRSGFNILDLDIFIMGNKEKTRGRFWPKITSLIMLKGMLCVVRSICAPCMLLSLRTTSLSAQWTFCDSIKLLLKESLVVTFSPLNYVVSLTWPGRYYDAIQEKHGRIFPELPHARRRFQ